jgi:hypothetical protein
VLLDKELPAADGDPPLIATGDTAQRRLRAVDPRRNADDHHLLPILILTKVPPTPALLNAQYRQGASGFLAKPATPEVIASEVLGALERAGRRDHAQCAKLAAGAARPAAEEEPPADPHAAKRVHVRLDRRRIGRRTTFLVDGRRADLQDNLFVPFFKLAVVRARGSDAYRSTSDLGIFRTPHAPSRIRAALEMVMPKGMSILQRGEEGMFRLHPLVVVEPIDWAVFEKHPHAGVQAVAAAERKLR